MNIEKVFKHLAMLLYNVIRFKYLISQVILAALKGKLRDSDATN
jgi:hypothetical protein